MENTNVGTNEPGQLVITSEIADFLRITAKWAKFLSIVGFVFIGLMVLFALFFGTIMGSAAMMSPELGAVAGMGGIGITIFYLLLAVIMFIPTLYLYKFSKNMKNALQSSNQMYLTDSFSYLKKYYKFYGIFMIVVLVIYLLVFIFAGIMGAAMM